MTFLGLRNLSMVSKGNKPDKVLDLVATRGLSQVSLSWSIPNSYGFPITSYVVERRTGSGSWSVVSSNVTTNSYTNTGLTNGTSYGFRVKAINAFGESDYSDEQTQTPGSVPSTPATPSVSNSTIKQLSVSWSAPSNNGFAITGYTLQRRVGTGSWSTRYTGTSTSYTDTSVTRGTTYKYRVLATNSLGNSSYSSESSGTTVRGVVGSGGTVTTSGSYKIHTFTGNGTFSTSAPGPVEVLIVGGGAGGAFSAGGGGGAGRFITGSTEISSGNHSVVVGGGGAAGNTSSRAGGAGGNSSVFGNSARGGGGGNSYQGNGLVGGSGGGAGSNVRTGGAASSTGTTFGNSYGNAGGNSGGGEFAAAGGGGAGGAGGQPTGGNGRSTSIRGSSESLAWGGNGNGGGRRSNSRGSGGGGGAASLGTGTSGVAGMVVIRYIQ